MAERWASVEEVSKHLNVSKKTIYNWLSKGKIPAKKLGNKVWRFKISQIDRWVEESNIKPKGTNK